MKVKDNGENDLKVYCETRGIPHVPFVDFGDALKVMRAIVEGETTVEEVLAKHKVSCVDRGGNKSEV